MENVILVAYLLIVLALIAVILLQRSEGGGLGMGGGNAGGLMTARGSANLLTRTTGVLAALFFATAIGLTLLHQFNRTTSDILDSAAAPGEASPSTVLDALSQLGGGTLPLPSTASAETPAGAETDTSAPAAADPVTTSDPGLALPVAPAPSEPAQESATSSAPAQ